ncbi:RrF2 family transcriptional regulator [Parafilimonas sp.]|uniref:RrF2 family transcriptional regulator n=1 Tax=Parafilimonas sp. TaxID=1969739 RepID=UPI0039E2AF21
MKITAQEEYGIRILIRIARCGDENGLSIPQISEAEGLTPHYVAKLTRQLRLGGFLKSTPGQKGGYVLSRPTSQINVNQVLKTLGGALFDKEFCAAHIGALNLCTNSVDCSARSLWKIIQFTLDQVLDKMTLADLCGKEESVIKLQALLRAELMLQQ